MLIRRINNINGERLRIGNIGVDPHGKLVCFSDHQRAQFILVEILSIYKHFEHYRIDYITKKCYDNKHRLPHLLIFKSEQILEFFPIIKLSQVIAEGQFIVIYYCTFVEIIRISLDKIEITFRVLYKMTSQILDLTIINENIYLSMYDGSMFQISLHRIEFKKKADICRKIVFINESMKRQHIGISESFRLDENRQQEYIIWQTFSGKLMLNKKVLSNEFEDNFDYENSFEEYLGKQLSQKHPIKYEMSRCRQYIIGSSSGKFITEGTVYTIKARWCDWAEVCELSLKPQINQFWTSYQQFMADNENWGFTPSRKANGLSKKENSLKSYQFHKILIAYYCSAQTSLVVSWLLIDKNSRKKVNSHSIGAKGKEQIVEIVRYKGVQKVLLRIMNLKSPISELVWIGLNQLLFVDKNLSLFFVEFDSNILIT